MYSKVFFFKNNVYLQGIVIHFCNPSTWEAEEGGF
jgi:hypothetical protein